jgi:hypothetical protein
LVIQKACCFGDIAPDKCHGFLIDTETKTNSQEKFAKDAVDEMSVCARSALALCPQRPSLADVSEHSLEKETPEKFHSRLLALYGDPDSMSLRAAHEFLQSVASALCDPITKYKRTLDAFQAYNDDYTAAAGPKVMQPFDAKSLLEQWPKSFRLDNEQNPSKLRKGILGICHKIRGSKAGDQYEISEDRQKTDNELLGDAIEATPKPDPTISGDYERWFCEVGSRRFPPSPSFDLGHSQNIPPSAVGSPSIPPSSLEYSPNISPSDLDSPSILPSDLGHDSNMAPSDLGLPNIPPFDLGPSQNISPPELELSQKIPPKKPLKSSKKVKCPTATRSQSAEADRASLNTCVGSDEEADHKDDVQ